MHFPTSFFLYVIYAVLCLYSLALLFIFLYSITQAQLVVHYLLSKKKQAYTPSSIPTHALPHVTIQLPIFNEKYVIERLLQAVVNINYPKHLLHIQVLDDSTDDSVEIIAKEVFKHKEVGFQIDHIRRFNREGFKAGALAHGLALDKSEFIAIFDADFLPTPDFLLNTVPFFQDPNIGLVQTKWSHINQNYSLLTQLQAFGLDGHFSVEQVGRNVSNCFINFNGTAGVWRKTCILDAGNWQSDTLTEDLDLSYRAQLKGWKFKYLENQHSPAELPPVMSALKSQQYRWTKGGAEVARKQLLKVLQSDNVFKVKWHALFHLLNSAIFLCIFCSAIFSVPLLLLKSKFEVVQSFTAITSPFLFSFLIVALMYLVATIYQHTNTRNGVWRFTKQFPAFLSIMMGLSLHNSIAVLEGYFGKKTPFVRTPKFNIQTATDKWTHNSYIKSGFNKLSIFEGLLALYFGSAIYLAITLHDFGLLPYHLMLTFGFGYLSLAGMHQEG